MQKHFLNFHSVALYCFLVFFTPAGSINAQIPNFHIGTKWIYETVEGPLPIKTSFELFQITDTAQLHGESVFVIEDGFGHEVEYMHVEDARVYFWDDATGSFQLTYDFESDSLYKTDWHACSGNEGEAIIRIDSVTSYFQEGDALEIQHIAIENNGSNEDDIIAGVYKNIGLREFGLRLPLVFDVCDFNTHITKLRCFENDSVEYHFVDYPCDSTWTSIHLSDGKLNPEDGNPIVYPNPTSGIIYLSDLGTEVFYEVYDLQGLKIQSGIFTDGEIRIDQDGMFILRMFTNNKWIIKRVVVLNK
ncbi:MAG TPA: T9SS type A sorting domain-containing protein [Saprospiraceae bacterium]|nr:T9SS type A sorting domain-containing protein [Saprospiraceae bacterium]